MTTEFGVVAEDYAKYRAGFPDSIFDRLALLGIGSSRDRVVDLGTGTGSLARGFALRGCEVIGIDPDERLLANARRLDASVGVSVDYRIGYAEAIPLADDVADTVLAGQCWHWFDGPAAAAEVSRITKPRGRVVVAHFDWLALPGNLVEATERLILMHNPDWHLAGGNGLHPESLPWLQAAGFLGFETFSYDMDVPYSAEAWRGRIRASAGIGASLCASEVNAFDDALARLLANSFPDEPLRIPHRIFVLVGTRGTNAITG